MPSVFVELGTDARSGMHVERPRGLIDELMDVQDADLVVNVFWQALRDPDRRGGVGHRARVAPRVGRVGERGLPEVMVYFAPPILADGSRGACAMAARLEFRDALPEIAGKDVEIGGVRGLAARGGSAPALPRPAHRRAALAPATTASCVFSCVHRCRVRTGFGGRGRLRRDSTMAGERCTAL